MDEAQWLASTDPSAMLSHLTSRTSQTNGGVTTVQASRIPPLVSDRKLRLWACACCRLACNATGVTGDAITVLTALERQADGEKSAALTRDRVRIEDAQVDIRNEVNEQRPMANNRSLARWNAVDAVSLLEDTVTAGFPDRSVEFLHCVCRAINSADGKALANYRRDSPMPEVAALLRAIVGNPFRPVALPGQEKCWVCDGDTIIECTAKEGEGRTRGGRPVKTCPRCEGRGDSLCPWLTPTVLAVARGCYEERLPDGTLDPAGLAMLSDALEEAGCDNADLLMHLRGYATCAKCEGKGYNRLYPRNQFPGTGPVYGTCWDCKLTTNRREHGVPVGCGFVDLKGPHYRGDWAVDLLLGKG